jgi:Skp family chaperone for outer membrane proteins
MTMSTKPRLGTRESNAIRVLLPLLLLGTATLGTAQTPAASALPAPRIGLIDASKLFNESRLGKDYKAKIQALNDKVRTLQQEKDAGAAQRSADLTTLREQAQKQDASRSPADRDDQERQIRVKERDLQAFVEDGRAEIATLQQRVQQQSQSLQNEYRDKMRPHIEAVARQKGLDFLIDAAVTLQVNGSYDISGDVIAHADAAESPGATAP